ncbi:MAG: transglycosylase domain-containing protein [Candidatus Eisenbacteria bacterium]|nr:transglycosylase domain-containing protein [Candidatus Eisenbacteria bacterium]
MHDPDSGAPQTRRGRAWYRAVRITLGIAFLGLLGISVVLFYEARTSYFQSRYFTEVAAEMTYQVEPGRGSESPRPSRGPWDERLGYVDLSALVDTLESQGYRVTSQARSSAEMIAWSERGIGPIYPEKARAGLKVVDPSGRRLYESHYPNRVYSAFDSIPAVVVQSLLFIENRELLQDQHPYRNPSVEWDRLAKAAIEEAMRRFQPDRNVAGGSTLATQIEKFRHSPGGITATPRDKVRQMVAASLRTYRLGRETGEARREILLDYLNSIPLAAAPGYGEVNGLGDGLWAWYGADLHDVTKRLHEERLTQPSPVGEADLSALSYRQVLSLLIAQRRPTYYLLQDRVDLANLTDSYIRLLASNGTLSPTFRDRALAARSLETPSTPTRTKAASSTSSPADTKAAVSIRSKLATLLDRRNLYDLDRLDMRAVATLDSMAQRRVVQVLARLKDPEFARDAKLLEPRMLPPDDLESVVYSFTLYERVPGGNFLRVQADNYPGALNLNESARLELGSTAKLRTLANYLQIIADLYHDHAGKSEAELRAVEAHPKDPLTNWTIRYLTSHPDATIEEILESAMQRTYSGNPSEEFYTGGGVHRFANFDHKFDARSVPLREGFQNSVNLVFIRLMRDVVHYYTYRGSGPAGKFLEASGDTLRRVYLEKFADREGSEFLRRFYRNYEPMSEAERSVAFLESVRKSPRGLAAAYRRIFPDRELAELQEFLRVTLPNADTKPAEVQSLFAEFAPGRESLEDQAYTARTHPLELWLVAYLVARPEATLSEVLDASREERREVYNWLYKTKRKNAQDARIRALLEVEAFVEIQRAWARFGYPFANLVPSYATSIGSSGDRASALSDLMGIIANDGVRQTNMRILDLSFAEKTPYEVHLARKPDRNEQVMDPAVARLLKKELVGVVEHGTARRAYQAVELGDGTIIPVGGKTGTGDNRIKVYGAGGQLLESRAMSRTATFVFLIGDRFYGTIVAYVPGSAAERYKFTSALPVQIFATIAPSLEPLLSAPMNAFESESTASGCPTDGRTAPKARWYAEPLVPAKPTPQ